MFLIDFILLLAILKNVLSSSRYKNCFFARIALSNFKKGMGCLLRYKNYKYDVFQ